MLTKRSHRIAQCLPDDWGQGYANVWLGVSVESQPYVTRIDDLSRVPAAVRFVSAEPLLGPLDLREQLAGGLDWVIVGGESGGGFRPMQEDWARSLREQCREAGKSYFFKQHAAFRAGTDDKLDAKTHKDYPTPRMVGLPMASQSELF